MFGYIVANVDKLTDEEKQHYRSCYCGLCKALGSRHGTISRITLTYDMTFLVLFLSALYKTDNKIETERCIIHPLKPHQYWQNAITDYAADMNVVLAYYNFLDDWTDDKNILSLGEAKLFERQYKRIFKQYPNKCTVVSDCLKELSIIEKSGELNADIPANTFGKLMGEIFVLYEDEYTESLRAFGRSLGKFIYIMDACLDLKDDIKHERYNPLIMASSEDFSMILNLLMADCIDKYKRLPINQDKHLIENILYSGVWTRYEAEKQKQRRENKK
ncbi:DUF5685 family protein [Acetivibrio mesophilus]|uniref:Uncharacterized protein n=1 Tax=Acetivibrio mesophilus TaxID=2487273 RepID=A0A4Q0I2B4_9FIRM|nr:DUF5685 family protein [Acetivibrio mesophilus]ODM27934.1 hypothetical protein A7W90_17935 [Clostridium sp. Bc-iso-3]RXE58370.1 hypothetical protein EFD62_12520 [Acetivibrio mesophilus]HHV28206.1 hypothetical protein [Clostridium sp.]